MSFEPVENIPYRIMSIYSGKVLGRGNSSDVQSQVPIIDKDPLLKQEWCFNKIPGTTDEYEIQSFYKNDGKLVMKASEVHKAITFGKPNGTDNEKWKIEVCNGHWGMRIKSKEHSYHHVISLENNSLDSNVTLLDGHGYYTERWYIFRHD